MLTLAVASILIGGALALAFRVLVLVPVSFAVIGLIALSAFASNSSFAFFLERSLLAVLLLQAGYAAGLLTRHVAVIARAAGLNKQSVSAPQSTFRRV